MGLGQYLQYNDDISINMANLCCSHWIIIKRLLLFPLLDNRKVLPYPPTLATVPIFGTLNFLKIIENPSKTKQQQQPDSSRNSIAISISNNNNNNNTNTNTIVIIITLFAITLVVVVVAVIECWWLRNDSINKQHQHSFPMFVVGCCWRKLLKFK